MFNVMMDSLCAGKVLHSRMQFVPSKGFTLENKKFFPNLSLLVSSLREPLGLKAACGGSQYTELFKVPTSSNRLLYSFI
jgi:hypothetical protein